MIPQFAVDRS